MIVSNGQDLSGAQSGLMLPKLAKFKSAMDGMLLEGWTITLDLNPQKTDCPAGCRYSPAFNMNVGANNALCPSCKGQGFLFEPRQTIYNCNRRWTNTPYEKSPGGMIFGNYVRTKTVIQSFNHIQESLGATIDGVKVKLFQEPRKTGWAGTDLYVITWWERVNKVVNG